MDSDLINEIDAAIKQLGDVERIEINDANALLQELADTYVTDSTRLRWWESLKLPSSQYHYGDTDGLAVLAKFVEQEDSAFLIVTDDEHPPWPVYKGKIQSILKILKNCRFFEYTLVAKDLSWAFFDTHMNSLILVGAIGEQKSISP